MIQFYDARWQCLPSSEELPDSDETPVDNELQDLIPGLLKLTLAWIWADRMDWFFGVDMGIYYDPDQPPIVPDGFLSLGVERIVDEDLRLSYVLWEEANRVPLFVIEVVSRKYRGEYGHKKQFYAELGVLYYAVYSARRRKKPPLEVYQLVNQDYQLLEGNPVWMPAVNLGIGRERGIYQGIEREWLYWYDAEGRRIPTVEEQAKYQQARAGQEQQRAEQERQRADRLAERLRELGIDPDTIL